MDGAWFVLTCGWCDEEVLIWGNRTGFFNNRFTLPETFICAECGGECVTHDPPWTFWEG